MRLVPPTAPPPPTTALPEAAVPSVDRRVQVPPPCDLTLGMVCIDKSEPGHTVWRMKADERFANPVGVIQGGFLAAFADSAMGAATVTFAAERKVFCANTDIKVSFLRPATLGGDLTCTASVVAGGSRVAFVEAEVVDEAGRVLARASSTYLLTPRD
ncbi:MAG: PaaI family thioesterase [Actinobacteria bacterium]|nr:PaaI family thioesterase [Actinomycetota bacterium]